MAGLFGLFNYEKEGPGIAKDAPKKHGFVVFFETFFRNFWKFIPINLLFVLIGVPVLTGGLSYIGFTNVARNTARDKHSFGITDYNMANYIRWKGKVGAVRVVHEEYNGEQQAKVRFCLSRKNQDKLPPAKFSTTEGTATESNFAPIDDMELPFN
jgi:hypothetical protein